MPRKGDVYDLQAVYGVHTGRWKVRSVRGGKAVIESVDIYPAYGIVPTAEISVRELTESRRRR